MQIYTQIHAQIIENIQTLVYLVRCIFIGTPLLREHERIYIDTQIHPRIYTFSKTDANRFT